MILFNIFLNVCLIIMFNLNKKHARSEKGIKIYNSMIMQTWLIISMLSARFIFLGYLNPYVDLTLSLASAILSIVVFINVLRTVLYR